MFLKRQKMRKKRYIHLHKKRCAGFLQLCIMTLIGIIGLTVSVEAMEIKQLKQEIQTLKQRMEE